MWSQSGRENVCGDWEWEVCLCHMDIRGRTPWSFHRRRKSSCHLQARHADDALPQAPSLTHVQRAHYATPGQSRQTIPVSLLGHLHVWFKHNLEATNPSTQPYTRAIYPCVSSDLFDFRGAWHYPVAILHSKLLKHMLRYFPAGCVGFTLLAFYGTNMTRSPPVPQISHAIFLSCL